MKATEITKKAQAECGEFATEMKRQITIPITIDTNFVPHFLGIIKKEMEGYLAILNDFEFCVKYPALTSAAGSAVSNLDEIYRKFKEEL